jgi:hypothetical protein
VPTRTPIPTPIRQTPVPEIPPNIVPPKKPTQAVEIDTGDLKLGTEWDNYMLRVTNRITDNYSPPRGRADQVTRMRFRIQNNPRTRFGEITNIAMVRSSGFPEFDAAAFRALSETATLPPLYVSYEEPFMEIEVSFNPQMRNR